MNRTPKTIMSYALLTVYAIGFVLALIVLKNSQAIGDILTPWAVINKAYLYLFFTETLILGILISFGTIAKKLILTLLIFHSFLMFSFLPLSHQLFYGADGWRHLADVNRILAGNPWREVSTGGNTFLSFVGKVAYSGFWGVLAVISKLFHISLVSVLRWLQPILAGLLLPILGFWFGRAIGLGRRLSLLSAWFLLFPFAIQAMGSFSLPVNLWFLVFVFDFVILLREYTREKARRKIIFALFLILCFGYSLYPALFAVLWLLAELVHYIQGKPKRAVVGFVSALFFSAIIPMLEYLQSGSRFATGREVLSGIKQFLGNIFAGYLAFGPRDHDIATGNIFFNQVPSYAFVENLFTSWRYWMLIFMMLFVLVVALGAYRLYRYGAVAPQVLALFSLVLFTSYFFGRYIIFGGQIMSRRMEAVLAFGAIFCFMAAVEWGIEFFESKPKKLVLAMIAFVLFGSVGITTSYSLGPDARAVSVSQYNAMEKIAKNENSNDSHCVIADTYSLLVLEALSNKKIVGGGFPLNPDFSQPELEYVRSNLDYNGSDSYKDISYALSITGAKRCWQVTDSGFARIVGSVE